MTAAVTLMLALVLAVPAAGQADRDAGQPRDARVPAGSLADLTVEQLMQRADAGDQRAILEIGRRGGDPAVIPFVRKSYQNPDRIFGSASTNAQMALAKLGDQRALDAILRELRSDDPAVQSNACDKLAYVSGNKAIAALGALLNDPSSWRPQKGFDPSKRGPAGEEPIGKQLYPPARYMAVETLARIVPNPPTSADVPIGEEDQYVEIWRQWWAQHRGAYP